MCVANIPHIFQALLNICSLHTESVFFSNAYFKSVIKKQQQQQKNMLRAEILHTEFDMFLFLFIAKIHSMRKKRKR